MPRKEQSYFDNQEKKISGDFRVDYFQHPGGILGENNSPSITLDGFYFYGFFGVILVLLAAFVTVRSIYSKLLTDWTKLWEVLDLQEKNERVAKEKSERVTLIPSSKESQMECENQTRDGFEDAFTRILSTFQSSNSNQIFLRRDDVAVLLTKLVDVGACTSSQRLTRRLTFMDVDLEKIKDRSLSFYNTQKTSKHQKRDSYNSYLNDSFDSASAEEFEFDLQAALENLMPRERKSYEKRLMSRFETFQCKEQSVQECEKRGFADAIVSYSKPQFLEQSLTPVNTSLS